MGSLRIGDHVCGLYASEGEFREQVVGYVARGLEVNEKVLHITHSHTAQQVKDLLRSAGVDIDAAIQRGQFVCVTAADSYLKEGGFDPDRMMRMVAEAEDESLSQGYAGLRVMGEMTWALGGDAGAERLTEYEAKLNRFFPGSRTHAICMYDSRRFSAETLLEIIQNHPHVLAGSRRYDNSEAYYVPPEGFLGPDRPGAVLGQWLGNLARAAPRAP